MKRSSYGRVIWIVAFSTMLLVLAVLAFLSDRLLARPPSGSVVDIDYVETERPW